MIDPLSSSPQSAASLGPASEPAPTASTESASAPRRLKILSYNVHSCVGTDRKLDPARIADVIAALAPDVIGLQELDVGRSRTGGVDQAETLARLLEMDFHFHPALHLAEERYGDAILSPWPMRMVKTGQLPSVGEQRGALWVEIDVDRRPFHVINTHLGLRGSDRMAQMRELAGPAWLGDPAMQDVPLALIGDFNSTPATAAYRLMASRLNDRPTDEDGRTVRSRRRATFPSRLPLMRLDHIFVSETVGIDRIDVVSTPLARRASDHLPLMATIRY